VKTSQIVTMVMALAVASPAIAKQEAHPSSTPSHGPHRSPSGTGDTGDRPNSQVDEEKTTPYSPQR
jgi:hypothetical protein